MMSSTVLLYLSGTMWAVIGWFSGLYSKVQTAWCTFLFNSISKRYNKRLTNLVFLLCTVSYGTLFLLQFMALLLLTWAINWSEKNTVCNLRYGPPTQLVRGISSHGKRSPLPWLYNKSHLYLSRLKEIYKEILKWKMAWYFIGVYTIKKT